MNLSFLLRLVCLVIVITGAVHALLQLLLAACVRPILRRISAFPARARERVLYLVQIAPLVAAILFAGALCVPQYLRNEPSNPRETVSTLTLVFALAILLWFAISALRGLGLCFRALRFARACRRSAQRSTSHSGLPVLVMPQSGSLIALVGFFRPSILVSRDLLDGEVLDSAALALALDHERSHAAHRDNWKHLSLRLLPRVGGNPWLRPWKAAAEWAADDDAARGDSARLLLAETLLLVARCAPAPGLPILHTAFSCRDEDLGLRIHRLLQRPASPRHSRRSLLLALSTVVLSMLAAAIALSPWVYALSESILHIG